MKKLLFGFITSFAFIFSSETALAERALTDHFGKGASCYERQYTAEHLKSHPQQTVSYIKFEHKEFDYGGNRFNANTGLVIFELTAQFTDSKRKFSNGGECRPDNGKLRCQIECDGGGFVLEHKNADSLLLKTGRHGIAISGCDASNFKNISRETDDKVFLIHRLSRNKCVTPY